MSDLLTAPWVLATRRTVQREPVPGSPGELYPLAPFQYPSPTDFTLTAPWIAIATSSNASRANWWKGCYVRIQVLLPELEPEAIGPVVTIPVNRGARIIQVPNWAAPGYQVRFEFPIWQEQLTVELFLYAPP